MEENQITFIVLWIYTWIDVLMGSMWSFYQYKYRQSGQMLHTGLLTWPKAVFWVDLQFITRVIIKKFNFVEKQSTRFISTELQKVWKVKHTTESVASLPKFWIKKMTLDVLFVHHKGASSHSNSTVYYIRKIKTTKHQFSEKKKKSCQLPDTWKWHQKWNLKVRLIFMAPC